MKRLKTMLLFILSLAMTMILFSKTVDYYANTGIPLLNPDINVGFTLWFFLITSLGNTFYLLPIVMNHKN